MQMKRSLLNIKYNTNQSCPSCSSDGEEIGRLTNGMYHFGTFDIPYPKGSEGSIPIMVCSTCGLIYKYWLPDTKSLLFIFSKAAASVWRSKTESIGRSVERDLIQKFSNKDDYIDIIDVGSSDGGVLSKLSDIPGRHSGIDIVTNKRCMKHISGEYIKCFIEDDFHWSEMPYDVLTAFDLLEHLYKPNKAFENFAKLLKIDGILIGQTGNPIFAGNNFGKWWYLNLFEHHICWPESTLISMAKRYEFSPIVFHSIHKNLEIMSAWKKYVLVLLNKLRNVRGMRRFGLLYFGRDIKTLAKPFSHDHLTIIFKKNKHAL